MTIHMGIISFCLTLFCLFSVVVLIVFLFVILKANKIFVYKSKEYQDLTAKNGKSQRKTSAKKQNKNGSVKKQEIYEDAEFREVK